MKKFKAIHLPEALKSLVHHSVTLFGDVIEKEGGAHFFLQVESLRQSMANLRGASSEETFQQLQLHYKNLKSLSPAKRLMMARSFTLMLELMNTCENAYRTYRSHHNEEPPKLGQHSTSDQVTYVLTAHPTEARSPDNIAVFHQIQCLLIDVLKENRDREDLVWSLKREQELKHLLEVAWRTWIVRHRAPKVKDEAEHIYSMLFRSEVFEELLDLLSENVPLRLHTWVGGDKDGHPGVQEKTLHESLTLSRGHLVTLAQSQLHAIRETLKLVGTRAPLKSDFVAEIARLEKQVGRLRRLEPGDGGRVQDFKKRLISFTKDYTKLIGEKHPGLRKLEKILAVFPGFVVPLELRESSDVLMSVSARPLAIDRMFARIARLSRGGEPRWYAHGFIISMAQSMDHIRKAASKQKKAFGHSALPIIPLFEDVKSLHKSPEILKEFIHDKALVSAAKKYWDQRLEVMVGYSDSSKEAGVLFSRLSISEALPALERIILRGGLVPVFFHGSGGSVDRGGGSIQDQTAWWPTSALKNYKVTIQGEMVERTMATAEIARSQIEHILRSVEMGVSSARKKPASRAAFANKERALQNFAEEVHRHYSEQIHSSDFLNIVERATPYSFLRLLKMGSRPSKRAQQLQVTGLRAIPWILCWTQTRVLFPTWWGVGSAWRNTSSGDRKLLQRAFRQSPVFTSYVKALGFTLAKTELGIWRMYLEQSPMAPEEAAKAFTLFETEWKKTVRFFRELSGEKSFTFEKPWLGESIQLRSPMIHPLNLLQILAQKEHDVNLLRVTATGISSGMLTTG